MYHPADPLTNLTLAGANAELTYLNASHNPMLVHIEIAALSRIMYLDVGQRRADGMKPGARLWSVPPIPASARVVDVGYSGARLDQTTLEDASNVAVLRLCGASLGACAASAAVGRGCWFARCGNLNVLDLTDARDAANGGASFLNTVCFVNLCGIPEASAS